MLLVTSIPWQNTDINFPSQRRPSLATNQPRPETQPSRTCPCSPEKTLANRLATPPLGWGFASARHRVATDPEYHRFPKSKSLRHRDRTTRSFASARRRPPTMSLNQFNKQLTQEYNTNKISSNHIIYNISYKLIVTNKTGLTIDC